MPEIDPVTVQLRAEVLAYQNQMRTTATRVTAALEAQEESIVRLENRMDKGFVRIGGSARRAEMLVGSSTRAIGAALASLLTIQTAQQFLKIADEAKGMDATLKLATASFGSLAQAQEDVDRIAEGTRSGLVETTDLYSSFIRASQELGKGQNDAARATETFSKALKVGGAGTQEVASATLQMGQALSSANIQWEELGQILEASPRLGRLFTDALGVTRAELKKMAEDGKLSSDMLFRALTDPKFTAGIDAEFRQLPVTFEQSMTLIYNAAIKTFSAFDSGGQFSSMLASFFQDGANGFGDMEDAAFNAGAEIRATFAGLADAFQPMIDAAFQAFGSIEQRANYTRDSIGNLLRFIDNASNIGIDTANLGRSFNNSVKRTINEAQRRAGAGPDAAYFQETPLRPRSDLSGKFLKSFDATMRRAEGERAQNTFDAMMSRYDVFGNLKAGNPGSAPVAPRPASSSGSGKKTKAPKSKLDPEAFAREEASLNDRILALKADEVVDVTQRAKLETDRIEAARLAAKREIEADEKFTGEQKAKLVALSNGVAALQSAAVVAERDKDLAEQVARAREGNLRYERDALDAVAQASGTRQARLEAERRLLTFMEEEERARLEAAIAAGRIADAAKARADLETAQGARRTVVNRDNESPLERRRREVRDTAANMGDAIENIELDAIDRLTDGLADAGAEYVKLGGIAGDVINGIIRDLIRLAAQQAIFGSGGGLGGFSLGSIGKIFSSAGGGQTGTGVGFEGGGYTGDGPSNAVAGVVHKGEYVVPADAVRRIGVDNLSALSKGSAARGMTAVSAARPTPPRQNITNYYGPGADEFWGRIDGRAASVATPIARSASTRAGAASYAQGQRSAPGTINKYSQLKG